jgi:hypothetical protein
MAMILLQPEKHTTFEMAARDIHSLRDAYANTP